MTFSLAWSGRANDFDREAVNVTSNLPGEDEAVPLIAEAFYRRAETCKEQWPDYNLSLSIVGHADSNGSLSTNATLTASAPVAEP